LERLELLEPQGRFELLNLELLNRRKALNGAKRLNGWNYWNRLQAGRPGGGFRLPSSWSLLFQPEDIVFYIICGVAPQKPKNSAQ
jgi:hypothetical protein